MPTANQGVPEKLLKLDEAGERLALSSRQVLRLAQNRKIAYVPHPRGWRIPESAVQEYIEARRVDPEA